MKVNAVGGLMLICKTTVYCDTPRNDTLRHVFESKELKRLSI